MKYFVFFKKYWKLESSRIYVKIIEAAFFTIFLCLQYFLWKAISKNVKYMLWYYAISFLIGRLVKMKTSLAYRIQSGEISNYLLKPINILAIQFIEAFITSFFSFIISLLPIILITTFLVGSIEMSSLPYVLASLPFAMLINFSLQLITDSYSFNTRRIFIIKNLLSILRFLLSGQVLPLNYFPLLKNIWMFSPFSYVSYFQAKLLLGLINNVTPLVIEICISILLVLTSIKIWEKKLNCYLKGCK